ncbi:MAG TPA: Smr/MutS family protein, partial [Thauera aminoaromatica]|nr:Smr/MutS family protein [Thauera aminoaromatica]
AAYEGVMPLRDTGRVALDTPLRHHARHAGGTHPAPALRPDAIVLPADADVSDPAALFLAVVGNARPVTDRNRVELERPQPAPAPLKREEDERAALGESLAAPLTFEDRLDMGDEAAFLRTGLPRRVLTDLRRGRWVLQGQIDLHGLTRDEARAALANFLHDALAQGKRCIRVIHGKGHGSPGKVSILKQLSRGWLAQREEILAFCQAGPHDGGGGALLVLLRAQNAAPRARMPLPA